MFFNRKGMLNIDIFYSLAIYSRNWYHLNLFITELYKYNLEVTCLIKYTKDVVSVVFVTGKWSGNYHPLQQSPNFP